MAQRCWVGEEVGPWWYLGIPLVRLELYFWWNGWRNVTCLNRVYLTYGTFQLTPTTQ